MRENNEPLNLTAVDHVAYPEVLRRMLFGIIDRVQSVTKAPVRISGAPGVESFEGVAHREASSRCAAKFKIELKAPKLVKHLLFF